MTLAPLSLSLALLFWSWQGDHWLLGPLLALLLEWAQRTPRRWLIDLPNLLRLADLTSVATAVLILLHFRSGPLAEGLFAMLHWSPVLLLPLLLAQLLSGRPGIPRRALFYSQRRSKDPAADQPVDLLPIYLAACLLAAGQDSQMPEYYFLGLFALLAWLTGWQRHRQQQSRRRWAPWILLMSLALVLGLMTQAGLRQVQGQLADLAVELLSYLWRSDTDPFRASTALGDLGRLRLSDRILYRVETERPLVEPMLLRTASYDRYVDASWLTAPGQFHPLQQSAEGGWHWPGQAPTDSSRLWIGGYADADAGILPLPLGSWRIDALPAAMLDRHRLGAVRVREGPDPLRYQVQYGKASLADAPPGEADLRVPLAEQPALADLAATLDLAGLPADQAAQRLRAHFQSRFRYSLELPGQAPGQTALSHFLTQRQQGHCEYFASASVLLLRQAGIPARYAVGYSVQESEGSNRYRVRHSHGHAWTLYWHQGRWWNLDTTPAIWADLEADARPLWRPLLDQLSTLQFHFSLWLQANGGLDASNPWLWGLLGLLMLLLLARLRVTQGLGRRNALKLGRARPSGPFAAIEQELTRCGWPRQPWETHGRWLRRLSQEPQLQAQVADLQEPLRLFYRDRYHPKGISERERAEMQRLLAQWLAQWRHASKR